MDEPQSDFQDHEMGAVRMTTITAAELEEYLSELLALESEWQDDEEIDCVIGKIAEMMEDER